MFPDDLERFESNESFAQAYSVKCGSPTQGTTLPLYTAPQPEREPMDRELRNVIINDAEKSALPTRQSAAYAIDETERYHGIKP